MALKLILNGQKRSFEQLSPVSNLNDLIVALELKADRVAVELNGEIAPKSSWDAALISELDKIELVHFVGGGSSR